MANKLFVGNLPFSTTNQDLEELFAQSGAVTSVNIIMDKFTGRSRGFGFVEMGTDEEAKAAIARFHEYELNGRPLTVNEAKPKEPRGPRGEGRERW